MQYIKWLEAALQADGVNFTPARDAGANEILVGDYNPAEYIDKYKRAMIRTECNRRLRASDYTMLPDTPPQTQERIDEVYAYRETLQGIVDAFETIDITNLVLPTAPDWLDEK